MDSISRDHIVELMEFDIVRQFEFVTTSNIEKIIDMICEVESVSEQHVISRYHTQFERLFSTAKFYNFAIKRGCYDLIKPKRERFKLDMLSTEIKNIITHYNQPKIELLISKLTDHYKIHVWCYMLHEKFLTKKEFLTKIIPLTGTPIMSSPLIGSHSVNHQYLINTVYDVFYSHFSGKNNYKLWIGYESGTSSVEKRPKLDSCKSFAVKINTVDDVVYLVDIINSGLQYRVMFSKEIINKNDLLTIMQRLLDGCNPRKVRTELAEKFFKCTSMFTKEETEDMDEYVLTLRLLSKNHANRLASKYKDGCVVYTGYKNL